MTDYAGVLAFRSGQVALVRELREETGLHVRVDQLTLIAEVLVVSRDGPPLSEPVVAHLRGASPARWTFTFDAAVDFPDRIYEVTSSPL